MEDKPKSHLYISNKSKELKTLLSIHNDYSQIKYSALNLLFKDIEGSRHVNDFPAPQYVYGELKTISEYHRLFSYSSNLKQGSVFCDLGSGLGKANFLIASCFPVKTSIGIEAVPKLYEITKIQQKIFENTLLPLTGFRGKLEFFCGKVEELAENWLFSDVIFLNSLTWEKKVINRLLCLFQKLKPNTEIFTSTKLRSKFLQLRCEVKIEMNWGAIPVYIYQKISPIKKFR